MQFENVEAIDRFSAEIALASNDATKICQTLVSLAFHEPDWQWTQNRCIEFLQSGDMNIAGVSATCLGHIARIHGKLEKEKVIAALRLKLDRNEIAGVVEDALDDISIFS